MCTTPRTKTFADIDLVRLHNIMECGDGATKRADYKDVPTMCKLVSLSELCTTQRSATDKNILDTSHDEPPKRNSATGTRTRVARVRAEYPNQLDYGGHGDKENVFYFDLRCLVRKPGAWEFRSLRLGVCGSTLDGSSLDTFGCGHVGKQSPLQRRPGTTRGSRKREKSQRLTTSVSSTSSSLGHSVHTRSRTWVVAATTRRPNH